MSGRDHEKETEMTGSNWMRDQLAEARIVAGLVDPPIQQKLLSAIREFEYNPAKRDGVPIPSQLDIVIHIPR